VQSMTINERLVIAANDQSTVTAIRRKLRTLGEAYAQQMRDAEQQQDELQEQIDEAIDDDERDELQEQIDAIAPPVHPLQIILSRAQATDARTVKHAKKLRHVIRGKRVFAGVAGLTLVRRLIEQESFVARINVDDAADCRRKLTSDAYKHHILTASTATAYHAEQKLMLALWRSGVTSAAHIAGKKRPCVGCAASLNFCRTHLGMQVNFNPNPGGYWDTAVRGLVVLMNEGIANGKLTAKTARKWLKTFAKTYTPHQTAVFGTSGADVSVAFVAGAPVPAYDTGNMTDSDED
jgi:hypothetical protein